MKKRVISLLLVICMVIGIFTGCGKKKEEANSGSGSGKLSVGIPQSADVTDYEENGLTTYLEDSLGIEIEFVFFSSSPSEYKKQITLMCSADQELPDVLWGFQGIDRYSMNEFGEDGYFKDLTEPIEQYAENYKVALAKLTEEEQKTIKDRGTSTIDGGFYGMPLYIAFDSIDTVQNNMYINKTWLDAVGMSAPTNVDELYNVLKAFKEKDPNKNGQADEIPMLTADIEKFIINAFVYTGTYELNVTDGKVWNPYVTNEYRQALQFCKKLCDEGLLDSMNFTLNSSAEFTSLITPANDVARVGMWSGYPQLVTTTSTNILDQYTALAPLADETGKGGYLVDYRRDLKFCSFISEDCKDIETAMKFLDFFYVDETTTRMRHGVKDEHWMYEDGTNDYGNPAKIKLMDTNAAFQGNNIWGGMGNMIATEANYLATTDDGGSARNKECARLNGEGYQVQQTARQPEEILLDLNYTVEEYETRSKLAGLYTQYVNEARALFITGEMDPNKDADWNAYLKELEGLGEATLVSVAQSAYDRQ